jgi:DNA-binding NtrC family response regulator
MIPKSRVLVVDDDGAVVDYLLEVLSEAGYLPRGTTSAPEALELVKSHSFDLVLTDVEMPELRGTELLSAILASKAGQLVVLMTAFGSIDLAVQAIRAGACDFVAKPFTDETLLIVIERALRERQLRREVVRLRAEIVGHSGERLVAKSKAMHDVLELARRAAESTLTVLVTGESGTGKGALARYIHDSGPRREGPFVSLNCAALPETLAESELFGVGKGAFTDAKDNRDGLFVRAQGGTLFLDEIGELPLVVQAKLLHVLETGRVRPLGKTTEIDLDVRIVAATNRPLEDGLRNRQFRPDLYYRLNVLRLDVPPLRARPEDVLALIDLFLQRASMRARREVVGISAEATRRLIAYDWPGNVRELANALERAVALSRHDTLVPEDLKLGSADAGAQEVGSTGGWLPLADIERTYVRKVLEASGGNKVRAAKILGIDRRTLHRKVGFDAGGEPG